MSVREEDRRRNVSNRGLGLAAAAIGAGVGAALYYYFNRSTQEHPDNEGSTSSWSCEQPTAMIFQHHDDSYSTISEHSTSDTSMNSSTDSIDSTLDSDTTNSDQDSDGDISSIEAETSLRDETSSGMPDDENRMTSDTESSQNVSSESVQSQTDEIGPSSNDSMSSDLNVQMAIQYSTDWDSLRLELRRAVSETESEVEMGWDVTTSSIDIPSNNNAERNPLMTRFFNDLTEFRARIPLPTATERNADPMSNVRDEAFRKRSWSLEQCSICFEVMLRDQELMSLKCTHRFHQTCVLPWLQEKHTCPNCRVAAECEFLNLFYT